MPVKVVDASALGALVFGEPDAKTVAEQLSESTLVAPHLLWFELASIAFKKAIAHPDSAEPIREALRMAGRLAIDLLAVDHLEVIDLATEDRLTTYDASYLWLARRTGGELVTLDKRLLKAFTRKRL
ncbi:MAG: type II toxin-antitoxin system VapC family toxin [Desulfobacterales bacterium]|jgi:predicted nucleic acid-binding protein|nr:type II toxin-antitoxin system VapC family toxin [Desulfobacterales bacterium]